ncbi:MAG TPA: VCBS repeat-containing protein [Egicoccus sp.]|nr:VCBS repeat-containing protein [Egicoccus sp.]HSK22851.1 VCBS repeat-containing protein [Egicoccus sp.]
MAAIAMTVSACGGTAEIPELTATPLPDQQPITAPAQRTPAGVDGPPDARRTAPPADADEVAAEHAAGGSAPSRDAAMAALLQDQVARARDADHLAADVTGNGTADLVVAAVGTDEVVTVTLATWDGHAYAVRGEITAPAADRIGTPAARDVDGDGRAELLAPFTFAAGAGVVVAVIADDASLALPAGCPLTGSAQHRLRMRPGHPVTVLLACDEHADAGTTDPASLVLRWQGTHFEAAPDGTGSRDDRRARTADEQRGPNEQIPDPPRPDTGDDPPGKGKGPDGDGPPGRGGRG